MGSTASSRSRAGDVLREIVLPAEEARARKHDAAATGVSASASASSATTALSRLSRRVRASEEESGKVAAADAGGSGRARRRKLTLLPEELVLEVLLYLTPRELCRLSCCSSALRQELRWSSDALWTALMLRSPDSARLSLLCETTACAKAAHVRLRWEQLRVEVDHVSAGRQLYSDVHRFLTAGGHGLLGVLCDMIYTDSSRLSIALSTYKQDWMSTLVVNSSRSACDFKRRAGGSPATFLSMPQFLHLGTLRGRQWATLRELPTALDLPGFVGFAVQLVQLPEGMSFMRPTVVWGIFRDLMVFDSAAHARAAGLRARWVALDAVQQPRLGTLLMAAGAPRSPLLLRQPPAVRQRRLQAALLSCQLALDEVAV